MVWVRPEGLLIAPRPTRGELHARDVQRTAGAAVDAAGAADARTRAVDVRWPPGPIAEAALYKSRPRSGGRLRGDPDRPGRGRRPTRLGPSGTASPREGSWSCSKSTKSWDRLLDTGYRLLSTVTGGPKCIFLEEIRVWTGYLTVTGNQKEKEKGPPLSISSNYRLLSDNR